jgi:hypothetical protein
MAAANAAYGEPESFEKTMLFKCFDPILAARRGITAGRRKIGRYGDLIKSDERNGDFRQHFRHS